MRYRIHTTPIWDAFKQHEQCPLCFIAEALSARLVGQYLNEAVMEPQYRVEVNRLGFCPRHIGELNAGANKLGLSLQLATRIDYICQHLSTPSPKQLKRAAPALKQMLDSCVICQNSDEMMSRYAETIARMYFAEEEFSRLVGACEGFCMGHFAQLVQFASYAGGKTELYLQAIYEVQRGALSTAKRGLDSFADMFDHKRSANVPTTAREALPRAISLLK